MAKFNPQSLLQKQGWEHGQGLGLKENGIKEAVKVKLKFDRNGMGHDAAEEFTYHWWDHVFNKAANNLDVTNSKDGVEVKKNEEGQKVSRKKGKTPAPRDLLYGMFVKASTLTSDGIEVKEPKSKNGDVAGSDSDSDSDSDSEAEDAGTASKLTDEQLLKICGGRTAHKGARHGLTASAKLRRLDEQERSAEAEIRAEGAERAGQDLCGSAMEDSVAKPSKQERKKQRRAERGRGEERVSEEYEAVEEETAKQKRKKKKTKNKTKEEVPAEMDQETSDTLKAETLDVRVERSEKKASKTRHQSRAEEETPSEDTHETVLPSKKAKKRKRTEAADTVEEVEVFLGGSPEKKRKKEKKKDKVLPEGLLENTKAAAKEAKNVDTTDKSSKEKKKKKKKH